MKILHINTNYITSALHQTMMDHFDDSVENVVFVPTYDKKRSVIVPNDNVIVSECFKKRDRLLFSYKQRKILKSIERGVDVGKQDCIHAYTLFTDGNVAYNLSYKYNKPFVVAVRNTDVNVFFKYMVHLRALGVQILKKASAVFFLSPAYQKTVIEKYVPAEIKNNIWKKSCVIPNGIDDYWLENIYKKKSEIVEKRVRTDKVLKCIYVGGIDANKNVELTLKALNELNSIGWKAVLTCIGKVQNNRIYAKLKEYDCFTYVPPKKKEEIIDYYRKADVFIMPSKTETFGLVYAEAMSQGVPVIYSRNQGFDGQFEEGTVGYSVSSSDYIELKSKTLEILEHYSSISANCISKVKRFDWSIIDKEYKTIYEKTIGNDLIRYC